MNSILACSVCMHVLVCVLSYFSTENEALKGTVNAAYAN